MEFNANILKKQGMTDNQLAAALKDPFSVPLDDKERLLFAFVLKGVKSQASATAEEMDQLKISGWEDSDILDAVNHGFLMFTSGKMLQLFQID